MMVGRIKRCLAGFLAMATVLTSSNIGFALEAHAAEPVTVKSEMEVLTEEYAADLHELETEILKSDSINQGKVLSWAAPTNEDDLIEIETVEGTNVVYFKSYTDSEGNTWLPAAYQVGDGEWIQAEKLDDSTKEGYVKQDSFEFSGACTVTAMYQFGYEIDDAKELLNIPGDLAEGIENAEILLAHKPNVGSLITVFEIAGSAHEKIDVLNEQLSKLEKFIEEYEEADSRIQFVMKNGVDIKELAEKTYASLSDVYENDTVKTMIEAGGAVDTFEALMADMNLLAGRDWTITNSEKQAFVFANGSYEEVDEALEAAAYALVEVENKGKANPRADYTVETTVFETLNAATVTVNVKVETANDGTFTEKNEEPLVFPYGDLTKEDQKKIGDAIAAVEAKVLESWGEDADIIANKYTRTPNTDTIITSIDENGYAYEIVYKPNMYTVTINGSVFGEENGWPYGSNITLGGEADEHEYDNIVVGAETGSRYYDHGATITVTEDLAITRAEAAQKIPYSVFELLSLDTQYDLNEGERAILSGDAYKCGTVKLRFPKAVSVEDADGNVTSVHPVGEITYSAEGEYYEIIVKEYASGVAGMVWVPHTVVLMDGENEIGTVEEMILLDDTFAEGITEDAHVYRWDDEITHAVVTYKLEISSVSVGSGYEKLNDAEIEKGLSLPKELKALVTEQRGLLFENPDVNLKLVYDKLSDESGNCALDKSMMSALVTVFGILADAELEGAAEKKDAAAKIVEDCFKGSELKLFTYMKNCAGENGEWLLSTFWKNDNYARIKEQAALLKTYLEIIVGEGEGGDDVFKEALDFAAEMANISPDLIDEYEGMIGDLVDKLGDFEAIKGPHELLDVNAAGFDSLVNNVIPNNDVTDNAYTAAGLNAYISFTEPAPKFVTAIATVKLDGKPVGTVEYPLCTLEGDQESYTFVDADAKGIETQIRGLAGSYGVTADLLEAGYYKESITGIPADGTPVIGKVAIDANYTTVPYTVKLKDEAGNVSDHEVLYYGKDMTISLPAHSADENDPIYYRYTIDGKEIDPAVREYTFADFSKFENEEFTISRVSVDSRTEKMLAFVETINNDLGKAANMQFVPKVVPSEHSNGRVESLELVMTISKDLDMAAVVGALGNTFTNLKYDYVGFGDVTEDGQSVNGFVYLENGETRLSPQAFIDTFLNAGITSDSLINAINNNESIVETSIHLGNNRADFENIPLFVKLAEDGTGYLESVSSVLTTLKQNGLVLDMSNGEVLVSGALNEKVYNAYLSLMLLLDNELSIEDFDPSLENQIDSMINIIKPVLEDENFNWATVKNTLRELGFTGNLDKGAAAFEKLIDVTKKLYNKKANRPADAPMFENSGHNWFGFEVAYDTAALLAKAEGVVGKVEALDLIKKMIADEKLAVSFKFELVNIKESYEALVVDMGQSGLAKVNYTDDLAAVLENAKGTTLVVLLGNVEKAEDGQPDKVLNIKQPTIINLNGKQIRCDINANNAALKIVNSAADVENGVYAGALGAVNGTNVTLTAGAYLEEGLEDINQMISGTYEYTKENGYVYVENKYYTLTETDTELIVELTSDFAGVLDRDSKDLVIEMVTDILFRTYSVASVAVDGHSVYNFDFDSLLDYIGNLGGAASDALDCIGEEGITYVLNALLDDFTDYDKLSKVLVSEDRTVASYEVQKAPWAVAARINDGVIEVGVEPGTAETKTLVLKFKEKNEELSKTFAELDKIVTIGSNIILEEVSYNNGFEIKGTAGLDVVVNMLSKDGTASDYVTTLAVILAYNMEDGEEKADFLKAIEYYNGNVYGGYLKDALNAMTLGDLKAALDKAMKVDSFATILEELGLIGTEVGNDSAALEACYAPLLDAFKEVGREVDKVAGNKIDSYFAGFGKKTFESIRNAETGHYDLDVSNSTDKIWITITLKLFAEAGDDEEYTDPVQDFKDLMGEISTPVEGTEKSLKDQVEEDSDKIAEALDAYNKLTDEQKEIVKEEYERLKEIIEFYEEKLGVWVADLKAFNYKGTAIRPYVKVYHGATLLKRKVDYTLSWRNTVNAALATAKKAPTVIVKLKGNYSGTIYKYFTIRKIDLSGDAAYRKSVGLTISNVNQVVSTTKNYKKPVVKLNGKAVDASYFKYTYPTGKAYKNVDSYDVVITANNKNFKGSYTAKLNVVSAYLKDVKVVKNIPAQNFAADGVTPGSSTFKLTYKGVTLKEGVHYKISGYKNNKNAGTASVTLTGLGVAGLEKAGAKGLCFSGTKTLTFKIKAVGTLKNIVLNDSSKVYTGSKIKLTSTGTKKDFSVKATKNGKVVTLVENRDYTVTYKNNLKAGTATMTVKGMNGYTGTLTKKFTITKKLLTKANLTEGKDLVVKFTKGSTTPFGKIEVSYKGNVLKRGTDYTIKWGNNTKVRKATAKNAPFFTITGKGNFKGSFTTKFTITGTALTSNKITVKDKVYVNTNYNYKTTVTVKDTNGKVLKAGTDYKVTYGMKNAAGKWVAPSKKVVLSNSKPEVTMRAKIVGLGSYSGTIYKEFRMYYKDIAKATIKVDNYRYSRYTSELREKIENQMKVYYAGKLLKEGTDYDYEIVSIKNYQNAGQATVKITGLNTYGGTLSKTFTIWTINQTRVKLTTDMVAESTKNLKVDYVKSGEAKPALKDIKLTYVDANGDTIKLVNGRDYTVKFYNTKNVRKATAKYAPRIEITGKDNFRGTIKVTYTIQKSDVADLKAVANNKTYKNEKFNVRTKFSLTDTNGKKLVNGKDYSIAYQIKENGKWIWVKNSKLWNKANSKIVLGKNTQSVDMRVVFTGKGNYTGTITDNFKLKR